MLSKRRLPMSARYLAIFLLLATPVAFVGQQDISITYDLSQSLTLTGFVSKIDWGNSQVFIGLTGKPVSWTVEAGTPADVELKGWTRDSLKIGTELKMTIHPARGFSVASGPRKAYAIKIEKAMPTVLVAE
jgi:hypothetical protein